MKNVILKEKFLDKYPDFPAHMNAIGQFVYLRTYSRYLPAEGRRETWKETCKRSVEYNVDLSRKHIEKMDLPITYKELEKEAEEWFDSMFNLQQFLSGRTLWVGGAENSVADKFPLANFNCFTKETEFVTAKGIKKFDDFKNGDSVNVLTSTGGWKEATVREFGHSEIVELVVRRGKQIDTIRTTDNHRWYVRKYKSEPKYIIKTTENLKAGDVLRSKKRYENTDVVPCPIGIQHGIVYGDGTFDKKMNHCRVALVGEKKELEKYFTAGSRSTAGKADQLVIYGLPNTWKNLPSSEANVEYLAGFLMGLFATDGSNSGNQHSISSSKNETLELVRDICSLIGIKAGKIRTINRVSPFNNEESPLHSITLSVEDIKEGFHLNSKHKENFKPSDSSLQWKVVEVRKTGVVEPVWCVQEPVTESFTLANGILTKNCSFTTIEKWEDLADHFYLLLVGTGVGFKHTFKMAENIAPVRDNVTVTHKPYEDYYSQGVHIAYTDMYENGDKAKIFIGDSKEGWVEALRTYFKVLSEEKFEHITEIQFIYDYIRPKGTKLKTFGGTASGHESMQDMFTNLDKTIKGQIDTTLAPPERIRIVELEECWGTVERETPYVKLRPIHILDFGNFLGHNVVVGGKQ